MKKQILILLTLMLTFSVGTVRADFVQLGVFGGYTTVAMGDLNDTIKLVNEGEAGGEASVTEAKNGFIVGLDGHVKPFPFLMFGARLEYIGVNPAKLEMDGYSQQMDLSLLPLMVGLKAHIKPPLTGLNFCVGAHIGYAIAGGKMKQKAMGQSVDVGINGGGLVTELMGELEYTIFPLIKLDLMLGYRMAKISKMKYTGSTLISEDGESIQKYGSNDDLAFDFSGMNIATGITVGF